MIHVGLARVALLAMMVGAGELERFFERGKVALGTVLAHLGRQLGK